MKRSAPQIGWVVHGGGAERVFTSNVRTTMPERFCVVENTEETISFINGLRARLLMPPISGTRSVAARLNRQGKARGAPRWIGSYIDFATMREIAPASALILAAEYDRARSLRASETVKLGRLFIVNPQKWNTAVFGTLAEVGFFDILGIANTPSNSDGDQRILKFRSGQAYDTSAIDRMLDDIEKMFEDLGLNANDACFEINGALGEAMENIVRCAYPSNGVFKHRHIRRWWMTGAVVRSERRMTVAIFDQGVSIPGSLRQWKFYGNFADRFLRLMGLPPDLAAPTYDGRVIEMAIDESATSTNLAKHGKGLGHIKQFVDDCSSGRLTIISRCGYYMYQKGRKPVVKTLPVDICGTLIEWDVRI